MMDLSVLFEDETLLVINKPPGVVVNRAASVQGETVQDWAAQYLHIPGPEGMPDDAHDFYARAGIVHRIDKETSGCLLIAKAPEPFFSLQQEFKERRVKKSYLAIVHGALSPETGTIHAPVGRLPWNRERFGILPGGKDSVTAYTLQRVFPSPVKIKGRGNDEMLSLVEFRPETGRTHQIRVHCKYINHPIVADWQYAGRKTARADRSWAGRVMLHAWKIRFIHPVSHSELAIEAPIPDDMRRILPEFVSTATK